MIYADYNGSAPLLPSVREYLKSRLEGQVYANPNAIHSLGQKVLQGVEKCRSIIAETVGCYPDQLYFTSGASEGITTIVRSLLESAPENKRIVITSPIEHVAVYSALAPYEAQGFKVIKVNVDTNGCIDFSHFEEMMVSNQGQVALVTIMAANNETGVLQPYEKIAEVCGRHGVDYFSDTTQLIGKGDFNFEASGIDYAVCSGHKIGALTGTGFLVAREPLKLRPLVFGSTQEKGLRGGTQNYLGIESLAVAFKDFAQNKQRLPELEKARRNFEKQISERFPAAVIVGAGAERLAGTTLIGYPGLHGQAVQIELESHDIFVTTSAACADNQPETSEVLKALGITDQLGRSVVRISLSYSHGEKEYAALAHGLSAAYNKLNKIQSY